MQHQWVPHHQQQQQTIMPQQQQSLQSEQQQFMQQFNGNQLPCMHQHDHIFMENHHRMRLQQQQQQQQLLAHRQAQQTVEQLQQRRQSQQQHQQSSDQQQQQQPTSGPYQPYVPPYEKQNTNVAYPPASSSTTLPLCFQIPQNSQVHPHNYYQLLQHQLQMLHGAAQQALLQPLLFVHQAQQQHNMSCFPPQSTLSSQISIQQRSNNNDTFITPNTDKYGQHQKQQLPLQCTPQYQECNILSAHHIATQQQQQHHFAQQQDNDMPYVGMQVHNAPVNQFPAVQIQLSSGHCTNSSNKDNNAATQPYSTTSTTQPVLNTMTSQITGQPASTRWDPIIVTLSNLMRFTPPPHSIHTTPPQPSHSDAGSLANYHSAIPPSTAVDRITRGVSRPQTRPAQN
jgi:hypothetical protein